MGAINQALATQAMANTFADQETRDQTIDMRTVETKSILKSKADETITETATQDPAQEPAVKFNEAELKKQEEEKKDKPPAPPKKANSKFKSLSARNQELKKEYFRNDPNLTDNQKRYESKIVWPKHYKPLVAEMRMDAVQEKVKEAACAETA